MNIIDTLTSSAIRKKQVVITITFALVLYGLYSLFVMPRQEFPEFVVRQGLIVGVFPGATSEQVEEQLTSKVENFLFGFKEIDRSKTYSISEEGMMYIFVEVRPEVKNPDNFWADIRHGLNELKMSLPQEVLALIANNRFGDASAILLTMHSEQRNVRELENYLEMLEDELRSLDAVSKIEHYGLQKEQISIYLDNEKLAFYGINPVTLLSVLKMESAVSYAGEIDNGQIVMPVHLPTRYNTENDLAEQIVYTDPRGITVRLKDVARIVREYEEPTSYVQIDGNNCVVLSMEMMFGNNIVHFGEDVDRIIEKLSKDFPPDIQINTIADMPKAVDESVSDFMKEFLIAIIAVIAVTMILLPLRISLIAALTIPITVLISLGLLNTAKVELHTVSLAALIVVLGMVVDNTIVIIDNYVELLDHGKSRWDAARESVVELFIPVLSATLAIISVFVPMPYFMEGLAGDFMQPFPSTISITLGVSMLVAALIVPIMTYSMIKTGLKRDKKKQKSSMLDIIQKFYDKLIEKSMKHKATIIFALTLLILMTGVVGSQLTSQFGPKIDRNQFAVEIYLAEGTSLDKTAEAAKAVQDILLKDDRVEHVTAFVGTSSPRFHTLYAPNMPGANYSQLIVNTKSIKATKEIIAEYSDKIDLPYPQAYFRFKELEFSLAKAPIEVRISGNNIKDLKKVANEVEGLMRDVNDITWIRNDFNQSLPGIKLVVNEDEANRLGLTKSMIAYTVAAGMEGIPLAKVWEGDYPVNIVLKQELSKTKELDDIYNIYISSPFSFTSVKARQVVNPEPDWTEGQIVRRNGIRTLTVSSDVKNGTFAYHSFNKLAPEISKLHLPDGVSIEYGGDHEAEVEYYTPFLFSLLTSIVIIFFILLLQFGTVRLALIIMSTIPLCLFGAIVGLLTMDYAFGMTAFIGIISLVGMVIRNGIIYVDYAEYLRIHEGLDLNEAALRAGKRRMRPIFLTAAAAAVGVIPMIISRSPLWGPLGTVVCFGLIFTMVLTLVGLPVIYSIFGPKKREEKFPGKSPSLVSTVIIIALLLSVPAVKAQNVLTLQQCREYALENNISIRNSEEEIKAARHLRSSAFTHWFPTISATGMAIYADDPLAEFEMEGGNLPVYDGDPANIGSATEFAYFPGFSLHAGDEVFTGAVTLTQPVFAGGRIRNGNRLAAIGVEVQETLHDLEVDKVTVESEEKYWQIVSLDEKLKTILSYENLLVDLEKQVLDAFNSGLILRNDVLKVQLKLSEIRLNKSKLQNGRQLAMMAFCQYLGIPYDSSCQLDANLEDISVSEIINGDHQQLLKTRGEYQLLEKSLRAADLQTSMAIGETLPSLAIGAADYYLKVDDYEKITNLVGFVSLNIPISGLWGGAHDIAKQLNEAKIAANNKRNNEDLLILQMDKAKIDFLEARDQYNISQLAKNQAEVNVDLNQDSYDNGLVTVSDLLEARALLQEANDLLIDSKIQLRVSELNYLKVTGRIY